MSDEQQQEQQEFGSVDEALRWLVSVAGRTVCTAPEYQRLQEADAKLTAAVGYAQERGWPDAQVMAREDILGECVGYTELLRGEEQAAVNMPSLKLAPSWHSLFEAAHELALLMAAEKEAQADE